MAEAKKKAAPKNDTVAVSVDRRQLIIGAVVVVLLLIAIMSRSGGSNSSTDTTAAATPAQQVGNLIAVGLNKLQSGDVEGARTSFQDALNIDANSVVANYDMGVVLQQYDKKPADAITYFTKALNIDGNYTNALYNRAIAYRTIGDTTNAIADYKALIDKKPDDANSMKQLGDLLIQEGNTKEGNSWLEKAYAIDPILKNG